MEHRVVGTKKQVAHTATVKVTETDLSSNRDSKAHQAESKHSVPTQKFKSLNRRQTAGNLYANIDMTTTDCLVSSIIQYKCK